jgi:hypothetical protein
MGFAYNSNPDGLYAGIAVLGDATPNYYAIDNDATAADTFGVYDGFTDVEKFQSISSGIYRRNAGVAGAKDISLAVGAGPYSIAPGDTIDVGFAIVAGENLDEILNAADTASDEWPVITEVRSEMKKPVSNISLYPNPAAGELYIKGNLLTGYRILDANGKEHYLPLSQFGSQLSRLDVSAIPSGLYLFLNGDGKAIRFVKE